MSLSLPYREDVNQWSVEQLAAWLQQRDFPDIADIYLRKGIDGHKLITLEEGEHISILNSLSLRARLDLLNIIKKIKNQPASQTHKSQVQKPNGQSNFRKSYQPVASAAPPTGNHRFETPHATSLSESSMSEEVEMNENSVPYIDETVNEDYLVPLSMGLGSIGLDSSVAQVIPKKDRCPSPTPPSQPPRNKSRQRKKIQDLKLPPPPVNTNKFIPPFTEPVNKFGYFNDGSSNKSSKHVDKIESKDDFNAYEIIQESPTEPESRTAVESQVAETDAKPPNLPYRNLVPQGSSAAPIVPVRTHSSTKHRQHPTLHRPQPHPPEAPSANSASSTASHSLNKLSKPKVIAASEGARNQTTSSSFPPPSAEEFLQLDDTKTVPMNPLYKTLLDKPYFFPVTRNGLSAMLIEDGMFLVRPSTHSQHLLTLSISNNGKIFNIVIRTREDSKFALGTKKPIEMAFFSVDEIIKFHGREAIKVEDGSHVYLKRSPLKTKSF